MIKELQPTLCILLETHLKEEDWYEEIEGYQQIRRERKKGDGGGIMVMVKENMKSIIMPMDSDSNEMIWLKVHNSRMALKIGAIYMPQESQKSKQQLKEIYKEIEEEITRTDQHNERILLIGDFNCKVGKVIEGNEEQISKGGKLLLGMMKKQKMVLINSLDVCKGRWTRIEKNKKSILDYVLVKKEDAQYVKEMEIDEDKLSGAYSVKGQRKNPKVTYSDHNLIKIHMNLLEMAIDENKAKKSTIITKQGYKKFQKMCTEQKVSSMIKGELQESYTAWSRKVQEIKKRCTKTIKYKNRASSHDIRTLLKIEREIKRSLKDKRYSQEDKILAKLRIEKIKIHIQQEKRGKHMEKISRIIQEIKEQGGVNGETFWKFKKKFQRKKTEELSMVYNAEGERVEDKEQIKETFAKFYKNLLQVKKATTEEEKKIEIRVCENSKQLIKAGLGRVQRDITQEDIRLVKKQLKRKKAKDSDGWNNEMVLEGGEEMDKSIEVILNRIQKEKVVVNEWERMKIRSVHKKGARHELENRRGLFMTNIISKVYERIIKARNSVNLTKYQCGGVKGRSVADHLITLLSIIERNTYLNKETYIIFADAVKCFDKLWLDDGIRELVEAGVDSADAAMIYKMNEKATVIVQCPAGETAAFDIKQTVRQGTVFGPLLCAVSTDRMNSIGESLASSLTPALEVGALIYMDDITSAGDIRTAGKAVASLRKLEEMKKFTFSQDKSGYMITNQRKGSAKLIEQTERGEVKQVKEYKYMGTMLNDKMNMEADLKRIKEKLPHKVQTVKNIASENNLGKMAVEARLNLLEAIIIPSLLVNIEVWPAISVREMKTLESAQGKALKQLLGLPISTPYYGVLMETGILPVRARVAYKRMMLYHGILNSEENRLVKQVLDEQIKEKRSGTWATETESLANSYGLDAKEGSKMKRQHWKRMIKERVKEREEVRIKEESIGMTKMRVSRRGNLERKEYMEGSTCEEVRTMMKLRLHMLNVKANFKSSEENRQCEWCENEDTTEHLFECERTQNLRTKMEVEKDSINKCDTTEVTKISRYIKAVSLMKSKDL